MATLVETPTPTVAPQPSPAPGSLLPAKLGRSRPLFDPEIVKRATRDSFVKLNLCRRGWSGPGDGLSHP
jgi:hypothetical protein